MRLIAHLLSTLLILLLHTSCTSTQSVAELEQIQNKKGQWTKSLRYVGSSRYHHYFDQFTLLGDGWWVPGHGNDGHTSYRVARRSLSLPAGWEFPHATSQGVTDDRSLKVRVRSQPTPHVERRD